MLEMLSVLSYVQLAPPYNIGVHELKCFPENVDPSIMALSSVHELCVLVSRLCALRFPSNRSRLAQGRGKIQPINLLPLSFSAHGSFTV